MIDVTARSYDSDSKSLDLRHKTERRNSLRLHRSNFEIGRSEMGGKNKYQRPSVRPLAPTTKKSVIGLMSNVWSPVSELEHNEIRACAADIRGGIIKLKSFNAGRNGDAHQGERNSDEL